MARSSGRRQRTRGSVDKLPSGAFRVRVYAGKDPVTGRRHDVVEVIPAGPKAAAEAEATRTQLLNQVDERRHPRTNATVNQMLDRHFELAKLEPATRSTYVGYAGKHIRTLIGKEQVGALDADLFDSFYAELRRCRDHCDRRLRTDHRTEREQQRTRTRPSAVAVTQAVDALHPAAAGELTGVSEESRGRGQLLAHALAVAAAEHGFDVGGPEGPYSLVFRRSGRLVGLRVYEEREARDVLPDSDVPKTRPAYVGLQGA